MSNTLKTFLYPITYRLIALMTICLFMPSITQAQRLSGPEKWWVLFHPFAAMKLKHVKDECAKFYDVTYLAPRLDHYASGGKLDAFRHSFYMAAFAQHVKKKKVLALGKAHEKGNYHQFKKKQMEEGELPDSLSSVMDLHNNIVGASYGETQRKMNLQALRESIIAKIQAGECLIFRRDSHGGYTDCNGDAINPEHYAGRWFIPKCLVPSSYKD